MKALNEFLNEAMSGNSSAVLPIGKVNIKNGKTAKGSVFRGDSVFDIWKEDVDHMHVEVWTNEKGQNVLIFSSGWSPKEGVARPFHHDQNNRKYGQWEFQEVVPMKDLSKITSYGTSLNGFVYK